MAYLAGETITDAVLVLDINGDPTLLGVDAVFSSAVVREPSGAVSSPTISATFAAGTFLVSFPTDRNQPGLYVITLTASETGQEYFQTYDVDPVTATITTVTAGVPSVSFADFRARIGDDLQDHLRLTATADGAESVFEDAINLTDSTDHYRGSHGIVISATDPDLVGTIVRVEASSPSTNTLTFSPELPSITREGDVLDLFNIGGYGWRPQYYDASIRGALESAYPDYVIETVADGAAVFASDSPTLPIPEVFVAVYGVELNDPDTLSYRNVTRARRAGTWGVGWSLDRGLRQLRIESAYWRDILEGGSYRIRGYARHAIPSAPSDPITIDLQWLTHEVKARLAARKSGTSNQWQNWSVEWGRLSAEERGRIMTPREPNTQWL